MLAGTRKSMIIMTQKLSLLDVHIHKNVNKEGSEKEINEENYYENRAEHST